MAAAAAAAPVAATSAASVTATSWAGKHVLVTGGTGYIGSHTVVLLVEAGARVTIIDNLANSNTGVLARIATITGKADAVSFVEVDLRDKPALVALLSAHRFDSVIHFAGYKVRQRQRPASCRACECE